MSFLQHQGADPDHSAWVLASAGTGKTKILTDRVLRLLLKGTDFGKILCLTFTNAAAQEMFIRISARLVKWSNFDKTELTSELSLLLLRDPTAKEINQAKTLYEVFLNLPHKMHIYTIHSFCQKILKRFPIEAGVTPSFQVMDELKQRSLVSKIRNSLFISEENQELAKFFTTNLHELIIDDILHEIINQKLQFKKYFSINETNYIVKIKVLEIEIQKTLSELKLSHKKLQQIVTAAPTLLEEEKLYELLTQYERFIVEITSNLHATIKAGNDNKFFLLFLTKTGEKRSKILPAKLTIKYPDLVKILCQLQDDVYLLDQIDKTISTYHYSNLLLKLAKTFLHNYDSYKKKLGLVDYDDLIYFTNCLLANSEARDWVLYKLDGGIEHLLVDESQDTSAEQWQIIQNLIEEFYSGVGADESSRTIFVVGDEKQSIFSFQGANLPMFYKMNEYFREKLQQAGKKFKIINLEYSYRSTPAIIEAVYNIFNHVKQNLPDAFTSHNPVIIPFRTADHGSVELWPITTVKKQQNYFWPQADEHNLEESTPHKQLAIKIATYISKQIASQKILAITKNPISCGDFLILVRKRDELITEIINQLKLHSLEVAGIDRIIISDNLSVMDLISIAKFVLTPLDNLNLASLLKSPLIGVSDRQIEILTDDKTKSIWYKLQKEPKILEKLNNFINLYKITHAGNFFHYILDYLNYREVLTQANGMENNEAINELLYLAANFADEISKSLQDFIYWFEENEVEIKRSYQNSDKIRIMTVHSAKGLEAPIVILCDTTGIPVDKDKFIWQDDNRLLAAMQSSTAPKMFQEEKKIHAQKNFDEYLRLYYVALTRASDHLIICGYSNNEDRLPENCWYQLAKNSIQSTVAAQNYPTELDSALLHGNQRDLRILCHPIPPQSYPIPPQGHPELVSGSKTNQNAPHTDEILKQVQNDRGVQDDRGGQDRFVVTHNINIMAPIVRNYGIAPTIQFEEKSYLRISSPLTRQDNLKYGKIFHKILEDSLKVGLPQKMFHHPLIATLPITLQNRLRASIDKLIVNKEFTALFTSNISTEVNIGSKHVNGLQVNRIDLLVKSGDNILIIDYKSDINPPIEYNLIPNDYIMQLKSYKQTITPLYKGFNISCKILWLQTGHFTDIL